MLVGLPYSVILTEELLDSRQLTDSFMTGNAGCSKCDCLPPTTTPFVTVTQENCMQTIPVWVVQTMACRQQPLSVRQEGEPAVADVVEPAPSVSYCQLPLARQHRYIPHTILHWTAPSHALIDRHTHLHSTVNIYCTGQHGWTLDTASVSPSEPITG